MPQAFNEFAFAGVFPPRSVAFFRAALAAVLAILTTALLILSLAGLLMLHGIRPGFAQSESAAPAGLYFNAGREDAALQAPLLKSDVRIGVHGSVARVKVRQHFLNPTKAWMEGIYVFPLPERSAVDRLTLVIGDKRIEGKILERAEARAAYDRAAAAGQRASLLSSERPNVFTTSVANIGPGQEIVVEIEYQDSARYEDGRYALRFPMVVAPRYSPRGTLEMVRGAPGQGTPPALEDGMDRDLFGPVRHPDDPIPNPLSLRVDLDAGVPVEAIESLYHAVTIEAPSPERRTIVLADGPVQADRDFVLEWRPALGAAPLASVFAEQVGEDTYLLATVMPPEDTESSAAAMPRDVVVVIDTSGSMHGASLDQAKAAVLRALGRLKPEDRFNVIRFSSDTSSLFGDIMEASPQNLRRGALFVRRLESEGGTEMMPALIKALTRRGADERLRQVLFLTDGAVGNEAELFEVIGGLIGETRLFTVGIGSAPNSYFMRKAAEVGRGTFTHIGKLDEVEARMDDLFAKLERPALTDLKLDWKKVAEARPEIYPRPLPDLYNGQPLSFSARLAGVSLNDLRGAMEISGRAGTTPWTARLPLAGLQSADGVSAIWARAKIEQIEDGTYAGADPDQVRNAALAVALTHRLVTKYTSLVAIDPEPVRPQDDALHSGEIPRLLPAGWDYAKVFGEEAKEMRLQSLPAPLMKFASAPSSSVSLPQTATPAELHFLLAVALISSGLFIMLLTQRLRRAGRHV